MQWIVQRSMVAWMHSSDFMKIDRKGAPMKRSAQITPIYLSSWDEFMGLQTTYFSLDRNVEALARHHHYGSIDLILRHIHAKELGFTLSVYVN